MIHTPVLLSLLVFPPMDENFHDTVFHARTVKHIEIQYDYVRELINDEIVELEYCPTSENAADIFTKALGAEQLQQHLRRLGVGPIPSELNGLIIEGAC